MVGTARARHLALGHGWLALTLALSACTGEDSGGRTRQLVEGHQPLLSRSDALDGRRDALAADADWDDAPGADDSAAEPTDLSVDALATASDTGFADAGPDDPDAAGVAPDGEALTDGAGGAGDTFDAPGLDALPGDAVPWPADAQPADAQPADAASALPDAQAGSDDAGPAPGDTAIAADTQPAPPPGLPIEWCRLFHPAVFNAAPGAAVSVYAHVSVPGLTDLTAIAPDPAPWLRAEVGWGPVGALPHQAPASFTWVAAAPDPAPPSWLFWRHDRYVVPLAIASPGTWAFGARFSRDWGASWTYCDLDGSQNGYTAAQSGLANVH